MCLRGCLHCNSARKNDQRVKRWENVAFSCYCFPIRSVGSCLLDDSKVPVRGIFLTCLHSGALQSKRRPTCRRDLTLESRHLRTPSPHPAHRTQTRNRRCVCLFGPLRRVCWGHTCTCQWRCRRITQERSTPSRKMSRYACSLDPRQHRYARIPTLCRKAEQS